MLYLIKYNFTKHIMNRKCLSIFFTLKKNHQTGQFWPDGHMFDTPDVEYNGQYCSHKVKRISK